MGSKYMYFLYSNEQLKEKNEILSKTGKVFSPGTVVVNGTRKKFTQLSSIPSMPRFVDCTIVAEGDINNITYTEPEVTKKKGN